MTKMVRQSGSKASTTIAAGRRITIKIGSSLLIDTSSKGVRKAWLAALGGCGQAPDLPFTLNFQTNEEKE